MRARLPSVAQARSLAPSFTPSQWALRGVVLLAAYTAVGATVLAGESTPFPLFIALVVGAVPAAWFADSWPVGLLVVALVLVYGIRATDPLDPVSVLAASAVLAVHLAGSLAAAGPRQADLPPGVVRRFTRAWLLGTGAAALLWGVARLAVDLPVTPGAAVLLSLLALLGIGVLALAALRQVGPPKRR